MLRVIYTVRPADGMPMHVSGSNRWAIDIYTAKRRAWIGSIWGGPHGLTRTEALRRARNLRRREARRA